MLLSLTPTGSQAQNLFVTDVDATNNILHVVEFDRTTGASQGIFGETFLQLDKPLDLAFLPTSGNMLVVDEENHDLAEFNGDAGGFLGSFGQTAANLVLPQGVTVQSGTGKIFVADIDPVDQDNFIFDGDIRVFDTAGTFLGIFGESDDQLQTPISIVFHPTTGNLLVSDTFRGDVAEFDGTTGVFIGSFGQTAANQSIPLGLAFHPTTGNLFVSDLDTSDVREYDGTTGNFIGVFGQANATNISGVERGLEFSPVSGNLLLSDITKGQVSEFDGTTGNFIGIFGDTAQDLSLPAGFGFAVSENSLPNQNPVGHETSQVPSSGRIVSPYWQADSGSYTFMAVSHPSLTGMSSQIGVSINAVLDASNNLYGPAAQFTVGENQTQQVFIASFDNSSINAFTFPDAKFITGTTTPSFGHLAIQSVASNPEIFSNPNVPGSGNPDATLLNFWGAVVIQQTATGFAMEFIGDVGDSRAVNTPNSSGLN